MQEVFKVLQEVLKELDLRQQRACFSLGHACALASD
jgi:hypothetical protein